ncbi:hypothetical protein [Rhodococcus sp. NPDC127528]|uniref:hypothetical protein n=1 Tax=unclassified Rhodococcus (in: high G+C Gram-positive bacteria) TaxID=192944 RepID=UPI003626484D
MWRTLPDLLLRIGICVSVAISGYIHFDLYRGGYRYIHLIGPSFLLQAAASFALAVLLLLGGPLMLRIAAGGLSVGALAAFVLSRTVGIFGFAEIGWQPAPRAAVSVAAELATVLLCAVSVLIHVRSRRASRMRPSGGVERFPSAPQSPPNRSRAGA